MTYQNKTKIEFGSDYPLNSITINYCGDKVLLTNTHREISDNGTREVIIDYNINRFPDHNLPELLIMLAEAIRYQHDF